MTLIKTIDYGKCSLDLWQDDNVYRVTKTTDDRFTLSSFSNLDDANGFYAEMQYHFDRLADEQATADYR